MDKYLLCAILAVIGLVIISVQDTLIAIGVGFIFVSLLQVD